MRGKQDGEACNKDSTLKEVSEMDWQNSPTHLSAPETLNEHTRTMVRGEDNRDGKMVMVRATWMTLGMLV